MKKIPVIELGDFLSNIVETELCDGISLEEKRNLYISIYKKVTRLLKQEYQVDVVEIVDTGETYHVLKDEFEFLIAALAHFAKSTLKHTEVTKQTEKETSGD